MELQERLVKRALRNVDPDLALVEQVDVHGIDFWTILYDIGPNVAPLCPVDWRDPYQRPLPLSLNIVDRLLRQEGDVTEAIKQATAANIARKEAARQERMEIQEGLIEEYHRWDKRGFVKKPSGVKWTD